MKNLFYSSALLCAILVIFSCGNKTGSGPDYVPDVIKPDVQTLTTKDTISVQKFNTWRQNWQTYGQTYISDTLTRYFTMPLIDITEFEDNKSAAVVASRFHLGMELIGTDMIPHLMLVGVNSSGGDVIDYANNQYIYDVTKPCPSSCGAASLTN